ncbi:MAG: hypothetical protein VB063_08395 [Bacteroides graminisolvens]|nr:hypothetical protein [Bacteroides graminisolvens]
MINRKSISNNLLFASLNGFYRYFFEARRRKFGFIDKTAFVRFPIRVKEPWNIFLYENTHIMGGSCISAAKARFIMKKNSGSAENFMVVTTSHPPFVGEWFMESGLGNKHAEAKDIIVEEDVWIAANVTLLMGAHIGRGSTIGAGAVVRTNIPPYATVIGNPAKIVGFKFTPDEIIEHEKALYTEEERLPRELLEKNYEKYFLKRIKEIKEWTRL